MLRYHVLGPVRAVRPDGTDAVLGGPRLRALLTALAAEGGRAVAPGALAERIRSADAPDPGDGGGIAALQALIGRLRRAVGRDAVELTPGGYRLTVGPDAVDVFRFERLTAEGLAALEGGRPADAARVLDEALALWQGPPLLDLPDGATDPLAVRASRRHAEARLGAAAAAVALGRAAAVLPELTALAAAAPLDEPAQALRIRALAETGREAAALAAYEEVRSGLADRLGTRPGPELRALYGRLLAGGGPASRGAGYADGAGDGVTGRAGRTGGSPAAPSPTPPPFASPLPYPPAHRAPRRGNIPARLTSFVGRNDELGEVAAALAAHRLVTLTGPGGAGKTRLAVEVADRTRPDDHPDGVWLAELAPVRDEAAVADAVLTALGVREPALPARSSGPPADPLTRLVEFLCGRRLLLVLDNCEHVVGAVAVVVERVLGVCAGV
ncbi:BTAD domain-containing putative transcriptional regulator, partial [Streptomyces sp. NPDC006798]|uniref:AfsR/SARP family transcriptional regulator n=1 Tax=Streptomyces sp. NPDC006798 TaxID=3155462 RepID=UPI0033F72E4A